MHTFDARFPIASKSAAAGTGGCRAAAHPGRESRLLSKLQVYGNMLRLRPPSNVHRHDKIHSVLWREAVLVLLGLAGIKRTIWVMNP
jgi:hypothetical protein